MSCIVSAISSPSRQPQPACRATYTVGRTVPPKGLPTTPAKDRLAVAVPDHELEHLTYEDEDKDIADIGWWEEVDRTERRFLFVLHGRSGAVRYALIRTGQDWLLHRTREQPGV
jgi:hypothetical protein